MQHFFASAASRRAVFCATVLLAALLLSLLHAALPHSCPTSSECVTCRSLHAPALAHAPCALGRPSRPITPLIEPAGRLLLDRSPLLKPLRAPPAPATI